MDQVEFGLEQMTIEDIERVAFKLASPILSQNKVFVNKIHKGPLTVDKLLKSGQIIYGLNTGYGGNCVISIPEDLQMELPLLLTRFLGCALGPVFNEVPTRAIIAARLISLAKGNSGVRFELLKQLQLLLEHDILPRIPQEGAVGASGDLCHLSYIAAVVSGERDVLYKNEVMNAGQALYKAGLKPLKLEKKEALAIVNGTSVMAGLGCLAWARANRVSQLATRLTSLAIVVLNGNRFHYDEILFSFKNHPGQQLVADRIREDILSSSNSNYKDTGIIQDRYSLRCAPHVIGVLEDVLTFTKGVIEAELNSTNDNPVIDVETGRVFHGGMFYGGHMAMAMDLIKTQVASVADLVDRQMACLVDPKFNNGLPANLSGAQGRRKTINHGLKGLQISMSAWTAEALKLTMPASSFSRSTELHNQDKVSMGTISARDCIRVLDLVEQVLVGMIIAIRQAVEFRRREGMELEISENTEIFLKQVSKLVGFMEEDEFLEPKLRRVLNYIKNEPFTILF